MPKDLESRRRENLPPRTPPQRCCCFDDGKPLSLFVAKDECIPPRAADEVQELVDAQDHVCTGEPPSLTPQDKRDDAAGEDAQKLIAAGKRMAIMPEALRRLSKCLRDLAAEALKETQPMPQAHVAELFSTFDVELVAPLIKYAETDE